MKSQLEIERKFLIAIPDILLLESQPDCVKVQITQTYLGNNTRIRRWEQDGRISYIKTVKKKISEMTRLETEGEISEDEYIELLKSSDQSRRHINKLRYRFPYENRLLEIDIFDFWSDRAFLEIELEKENGAFAIPPFIKVIKEVTLDKRYRNSALAREIPYDEI